MDIQEKILAKNIKEAKDTTFGSDHLLSVVKNYADYKTAVPIRDYEKLSSYVNSIIDGKPDVLWPGRPIYFAKTSGTISGTKYIPITNQSIHNHIDAARNILLRYIANTGNSSFVNGKMIFLSGSPEMEKTGNIRTGRLSGTVNHHVPAYLRSNQLPTYKVNCIEDWETKLDGIVEQTVNENMTLVSGIPPWVQMYFDKLLEVSGKQPGELFPNLSLFVHGCVNYQPYKEKLERSIGNTVDTLETYPASEGFIAFQDTMDQEGLLLNVSSGIFFEFVPVQEIFSENPQRLSLGEVKVGEDYAIILTTNAGLWAYDIGDTVRFVSIDPWRIVVTGRTKHFISAFGEHVLAEEVQRALMDTAAVYKVQVVEFTVAPQVNPESGEPYHEWFIEFDQNPQDLNKFALDVDERLQGMNSYYKDLIIGKVLQPLKLRVMKRNAFIDHMRSIGKLGAQNKLPRLANDRGFIDGLDKWIAE